jgi:hypothetical protein
MPHGVIEPDLPGVSVAAEVARATAAETDKVSKSTTGTQTLNSSLTFAAQKKLQLSVNDGGSGSITRLIEFSASNIVDRPWMGWFDQTARLVGATGFHDTLNAGEGGAQLKQYEVKTVASSSSGNPTEQRTRLAIQYDVQRGTWGVNFIDNFEINQGENPILTSPTFGILPAGLRIRLAPQDTFTSSNFVAAQFMAETDASDNVIGFLDVNVPYASGGSLFPGNKTATLDIFRNTNSSSASSPQLAVKKGDGTNTNALLFTAKSGLFELPLALSGTTGFKLGGDTVATLYRSAASTVKTDATLQAALGIATLANAGTPTDSLITTPTDGLLIVDTTHKEAYFRTGASWRSTEGGYVKQTKALGWIAQTMDRSAATQTSALMVTQTPYYASVYLKDGDVITNIKIDVATAASVQPTNFFAGLYLVSTGARQALSTDQASVISTTTGEKVLPLSSPFTVPAGGEGLYYVALLCVQASGTLPAIVVGSKRTAGTTGSSPRSWANDSVTGTTFPTTATIAAGSLGQVWAALY